MMAREREPRRDAGRRRRPRAVERFLEHPVVRLIRKIVVGVVGITIAVVGLVSGPIILGPNGAIMIVIGVGMLATEFVWAQRMARRGQAAVHAWGPRVVGARGKSLWRWKKRIRRRWHTVDA
jgi:hypothetical protein